MQTAVQERFGRLMLLALSLAAARPALACEVFTSVESEACDGYLARVTTHGNWVDAYRGGTYCELPGDVVHGPGTTYSASSTRDGSLTTSVSTERITRTYTPLGSATWSQWAVASAVGYADRSVDGASSVEITVSLTVGSLTSSSEYSSSSDLAVLLEPTLGCSDGSTPVESGSLYAWDDSAIAPGPRLIVLSATCPAGTTLVGVARARISLESWVNTAYSAYGSAAGEVRVHSVEVTRRN